jgi:hypothetical protein
VNPFAAFLKGTTTRMAEHGARSGMHFALHSHLLFGLVVFAGALVLFCSLFASRAPAQVPSPAWSGYLVVDATYHYGSPGPPDFGEATGATHAAYYFDGDPASVVLDTGPGGTQRIWQQRVRWAGSKLEIEEGFTSEHCRRVSTAAGSGFGTATLDLHASFTAPPPVIEYFIRGGYDELMTGTSILNCANQPPLASPYNPAPCLGPAFGLPLVAPQGMDSLTLRGSQSIQGDGGDVGCSSDLQLGQAVWSVTREPNPPQCSNGKDDDGDGRIDYAGGLADLMDPGCESDADNTEADVAVLAQCADGIDNDADGVTDYPSDASCSSATDNDETNPPQCSDGIDNDAGGATDFPDDPGCSSATDNSENTDPDPDAFQNRSKYCTALQVAVGDARFRQLFGGGHGSCVRDRARRHVH